MRSSMYHSAFPRPKACASPLGLAHIYPWSLSRSGRCKDHYGIGLSASPAGAELSTLGLSLRARKLVPGYCLAFVLQGPGQDPGNPARKTYASCTGYAIHKTGRPAL